MKILEEKYVDIEILLSVVRTLISRLPPMTPSDLRGYVDAQVKALNVQATPEEIERACETLEREFNVNLGPAHDLHTPDHRPWLAARRHQIQFKFWQRYRSYLVNSGFGQHVVNRLDEITDRILDLAGDPLIDPPWTRRGLVVGHVQSGKTANYVGLINKAADAGYRIIILIAGIHNNLRSQTQERVDEGFVGFDSEQLLSGAVNPAFLGVGRLDPSFRATCFSSRARDFSMGSVNAVPINNLNGPAIFVIKKNKAILENLINWLKAMGGLTVPMLVIDDEADNASVNVAGADEAVRKINELIRTLLKLATRNTYIGYTATPFANIFINPDSEHSLIGEDLFPRDFIVGLDAPTNYVGANDYFLSDEKEMTVTIKDTDKWLPVSHKIDHAVEDLHPTLEDAINCFVLSKAIRILRHQGDRHHSMLVNVSRFTGIQGKVRRLIGDYVLRLRDAVENRYALAVEQALRDPVMRSLHASWSAHYRDTSPETWPSIQAELHRAAAGIQVVEVNASSGAGVLDYRRHAATGMTVIAVGGNSLSRGFTLEGLTVSYFLRNTQMYDTLLQMGRWFGYRDGYADLCRLFIQSEAEDWYAYIAEATEELREDIERMGSAGLTPKDFGMAVRSHPGSLLVTARNKMRTATQIVREVGLAQKLVETATVHATPSIVEANVARTTEAIRTLDAANWPREYFPSDSTRSHPSVLFRQVTEEFVVDFIRGFQLHPANIQMEQRPLTDYIVRRNFRAWDVVVVSKSESDATLVTIGSLSIGLQQRSAQPGKSGTPALRISGDKLRVASRGLEAAGLSQEERQAAYSDWERDRKTGKIKGKNIADSYFRAQRSRPLLMLHLFEVIASPGEPTRQHAAYGISFPALRPGESEQRVTYTANVIAFRELFGTVDAEGDEDDIDD